MTISAGRCRWAAACRRATSSSRTASRTKQAGEPDHAGDPGGASLWFKWTAPVSGRRQRRHLRQRLRHPARRLQRFRARRARAHRLQRRWRREMLAAEQAHLRGGRQQDLPDRGRRQGRSPRADPIERRGEARQRRLHGRREDPSGPRLVLDGHHAPRHQGGRRAESRRRPGRPLGLVLVDAIEERGGRARRLRRRLRPGARRLHGIGARRPDRGRDERRRRGAVRRGQQLRLRAVAGTTYRVAVDGTAGDDGYFDSTCARRSNTRAPSASAAPAPARSTLAADAVACASLCSYDFEVGESVTLSASPAPGSSFTGWSGCTGTGACQVTLNTDTAVVANFSSAAAGGGGGESQRTVPAPSARPAPKPLHCGRGFRKVLVRGKAKCVRKKPRHHHRKRRHGAH